MARTIIPEEPRVRTKIPDEHIYTNRCFWQCPCGGTVPDVSEECPIREYVKKANTFCAAAAYCHNCKIQPTCHAYKTYIRLMRLRRQADSERVVPTQD